MKISAVVYNLDENEKVAKVKVEPDQIFDEHIDNKLSRKRFTYTFVKKESIIEYKYELVSAYSFNKIDLEIQLPIGYEIEGQSELQKEFDSNFGSYEAMILHHPEDNKLFYTRHFEINRFDSPGEEYSDLRSFLKKVAKADKYQVVLKEKEAVIVEN